MGIKHVVWYSVISYRVSLDAKLSIYASKFSAKTMVWSASVSVPVMAVSLQNNDDVGDQIYGMRFPPFRCKSRFCLQIVLFRACVFCSIIFGHDWSETLKLFAYRSEVGFEILIFMLHGDGKLKNVNLLVIAFIWAPILYWILYGYLSSVLWSYFREGMNLFSSHRCWYDMV